MCKYNYILSGIKQLWVHEVLRVYYDRLVDEEDQLLMFNEIKETIISNFNTDFDKLFATYSDGNEVTQDHLRSLMYCDFVADNDAGLYMQVPSVDEIRVTAEEQLTEFNLVDKKYFSSNFPKNRFI